MNPASEKIVFRNVRRQRKNGFALVVTLSLMILLTVVAVGLLSMASISLRSSSQSEDMSAARSNARMALMLALGDLQKTAGLDTRITARADLVNENNPPVLGVWKSWEGTDHDGTGRPIAPDYSNHKGARFIEWLASAPLNTDINQVPDTKIANGKVALLGENSVGKDTPDKRQIHLAATKLTVNKNRGSYAWWVSGENQKARLPRPYAPAADNAATWSVMAKTHASADTAPFGLDKLLTDPSLKDPALASPVSNVITLKQSDLLDVNNSSTTKFSQESFHDLSTNSIGLLTNAATGGWRKDLTLVTDNWLGLPSSSLPFFRVSPTKDLLFNRPEADALNAKSLLYPWSDYRRGATTNVPIYSFPAIGSWANLANYATLYKVFNSTSSGATISTEAQADTINGNVYNYIHKVRILPVIARVQWIYSHQVVSSPTFPGKYDLNLVITPVFTLWNPYNVRISSTPGLTFSLHGSLPPVIDYKIGGAPLVDPKKITLQNDELAGDTATNGKGLTGITNYTLNGIPAFAPGETRVFSPSGASNVLIAGYTPGSGVSYPVQKASATTPAFSGSSKITTSVTFDSEFADAGATGVGLYLNMDSGGSSYVPSGTVLAYRMSYEKTAARTFYPPLAETKLPSPTLAEAATATPFLSVTFGARMASNTHLPSKGFVQSSPFVNYTAMGQKGQMEPTIQYTYPGTLNNVNSPFEYSFQGLLANSPYLPEVGANNRGFILTGFKISNGLSRCVISELPGRALNSLAELQNWDARYENPVPPFSFNLVGNSDASPLLPANAVNNSSESSTKGAQNLQNDDSYCLNHVLFDDWFFSSIAPEPTGFGKPSPTSTAKSVYTNFLKDPSKPLANRSYKPLPQDVSFASDSAANANTVAAKNVGTASTSWKTIASRLEVEGMFNVNSTSVKAWRSLLGHARNQKVPFIAASGNLDLSTDSDYAISRFSVAGDVESKKSGSSGGFTACAEYAGYRVYDGSQLDFLAQEIVNQVRLRGPFLSLSEFVNRQLSSGDMAIAGAVQTALNKLAGSGQNPFKVIQADTTPESILGVSGSNIATASPPGGNTGYKFPAAAVGYNLYGIPGWTRQADILRPLAPVLSVRDDTFTIRAYGDSRDVTGNIVKARAVCEATLRRTREFVDPSDDAATVSLSNGSGSVSTPKVANALFGRRFEIISFRWLAANEI